MKRLSIITVNKNNWQGLKSTLDSIFHQSFQNYETIVIDGGSNDKSPEILRAYSGRISYWVSKPDRGIYHAMNKGIGYAKGEYLLFLNSGDILINDTVLDRVLTNDMNADILYGYLDVVKNGKKFAVATTPDQITLRVLLEETIHHQAAFIRKTLFDQFGLYNERYRIRADWDFWIRSIILGNCITFPLNKTISVYNLEGFSATPNSKALSKEETQLILKSYFPEKIIIDYNNVITEIKELEPLFWIKSKKILYNPLLFLFKTAVKLFGNKKVQME